MKTALSKLTELGFQRNMAVIHTSCRQRILMAENQYIKINRTINDKLVALLSGKANTPCMYPGCSNRSVRSHALSKISTLSVIAENGVVVSPLVKRDDAVADKKIVFEEVGVSRASTFRGFCNEHEQLFYDVDTRGIKTIRDIFAQVYRSLCKYLFINKSIKVSEILIYKGGFVYCENWEEGKHVNTERLSNFFYDLLLDFPEADKAIDIVAGAYNFFKPFSSVDKELDISILYKHVDIVIPVAMQKRFELRKNSKIYESLVIVIPDYRGTSIIIISDPDDENDWRRFLIHPIDTLCFVELVMMADSEWYLAPAVVRNWTPEKRNYIEKDFRFFTERRFLEHYDVSIFDEVRLSLVEKLSSERRNMEIHKIDNLPQRRSDEERESVLTDTILSHLAYKYGYAESEIGQAYDLKNETNYKSD